MNLNNQDYHYSSKVGFPQIVRDIFQAISILPQDPFTNFQGHYYLFIQKYINITYVYDDVKGKIL